MSIKKVINLLIVIFLVFLLGRVYTSTKRPGRTYYFELSGKESKSVSFFRCFIDTINIADKKIIRAKCPGGEGGEKYFLGWKYDEFDPISIKRLYIKSGDSVLHSYRFGELDSLQFGYVDTFKVVKLPISFSKVDVIQ